MPAIYEKYRPQTLAQVIAQPKAVALVQSRIDRGALGGNAYLITGASGTGKTTLAHIMAREIADGFNISEFDAIDATPAKIRDMEESWSYRGMGEKHGRAWIINEIHTLSSDAVGKFLTALERIPDHVIIIFTTTLEGIEAFGDARRDAKPFISRCIPINLALRGLCEPFAQRALEIAQAENLDGRPLDQYIRLAKDCGNNFRLMLQRIDAGAMLPA